MYSKYHIFVYSRCICVNAYPIFSYKERQTNIRETMPERGEAGKVSCSNVRISSFLEFPILAKHPDNIPTLSLIRLGTLYFLPMRVVSFVERNFPRRLAAWRSRDVVNERRERRRRRREVRLRREAESLSMVSGSRGSFYRTVIRVSDRGNGKKEGERKRRKEPLDAYSG